MLGEQLVGALVIGPLAALWPTATASDVGARTDGHGHGPGRLAAPLLVRPTPARPNTVEVAASYGVSRVRRVPGAASAVADASTPMIPEVALAAYRRAEVVIELADPRCHLDWELLAAIGRVESDHGRYGGSVLGPDGLSRPGVYGIPLDGRHGTALVRDTDAGQYDGDPVHDRAVGAMQFIPSTWAVVGVDADGDGRRDPQDIDDAALAAAVYLCSGPDDLATISGRQQAVFRYNHSWDYVALVLDVRDAYLAGAWSPSPTTAVVVVESPPVQGPGSADAAPTPEESPSADGGNLPPEPTEPSDPGEPSAITQPPEPTEQTEPPDPSEPVDSVEPVDPVDPVEPTDPCPAPDPAAPDDPETTDPAQDPAAPESPEPIDPATPGPVLPDEGSTTPPAPVDVPSGDGLPDGPTAPDEIPTDDCSDAPLAEVPIDEPEEQPAPPVPSTLPEEASPIPE